MDERDDLYERIIDEYLSTGSVKQVVENLKTNTIKVRRVLITEGLWESESSRKVGELFEQGKSVKEIAEILCMSEKNVQSYMPYTRGTYGGTKSDTAERSEAYRNRMKQAAENQVSMQRESAPIKDIKDADEESKIIKLKFSDLHKEEQREESTEAMPQQLPSVLKLRFELVAPYYRKINNLDMEPEEEIEFLRNAKAENGIIREVLVPGEMNLHALHYMIQRLFGWQNSHLHRFALKDEDFDMVTDNQDVERYFDLCGTLFRFPGAAYDDVFWDDDYTEGISIKSWLRSKYNYGRRDLAVENSYIRSFEKVNEFYDRFEDMLADATTLDKLEINFDNPYNQLIEGIAVRNLFAITTPDFFKLSPEMWKRLQDALIQNVHEEYMEIIKEDPEEYNAILTALQDLIDLRSNILNVNKAIRYGRYDEVEKFYKKSPLAVLKKQKKMVAHLEEILLPHLSMGNPSVLPFIYELYYEYDYGDDWCVRITCVDAYTANENYDSSHVRMHMTEDGVFEDDRQVDCRDLQYTDLKGYKVDSELREKLQTVYLKEHPICVMADGLNVMDDVGGLYGYQEFLQTINGKDAEEKERMKQWAKSMGWTGRKVKPENIL